MKRMIWKLALAVCPAALLAQELTPPRPTDGPQAAALGLPDLIRISLERNPALQQRILQVEQAQGRAVQAGLYPNPTVSVIGEEMGDPQGPGGFITAPLVSQEIVTGKKLRLSQAVAQRGVDQAGLATVRERFALYTVVRQGYYSVLAAQQRVEILQELAKVAGDAFDNTRKLLEAKQVAELDLLPFQLERDRYQIDLESARYRLQAAWRSLTASMGAPELEYTSLTGSLDGLPDYDFESSRAFMLGEHPDVLAARVGVSRAEIALRRERVESLPNVTVAAGYMRDDTNRSNEWTFQVGMPVPVFNRNQGNIRAAQAELGQSQFEISRVETELIARLATAFGEYSAARQRVERYQKSIRPVAERTYQLSMQAFKGGQFEYLRVLQAQRALAEAKLEQNRAVEQAWQAASVIAGLLLEEQWPVPVHE